METQRELRDYGIIDRSLAKLVSDETSDESRKAIREKLRGMKVSVKEELQRLGLELPKKEKESW